MIQTQYPTVSELLLMTREDRNAWRRVFVEEELELQLSGCDQQLINHVSDLHDAVLTIENAVQAANVLRNDF